MYSKKKKKKKKFRAAGGSIETVRALAEYDLVAAKSLAKAKNEKGKTPSELAGYWKRHQVREIIMMLEHGGGDF